MRIQAVLFDGFDEIDVVGAFEPLRMAGLDVELLSLYKQDVVTAAHGATFVASGVLDVRNKPDILYVPGGGWLANAGAGAKAEAKKGFILERLKEFHKAGVVLAAVCTGALLLGKADLLQGRPATTNHAAIEDLKECGAKYIEARVVDDDDIVTASGVTSSLDLGLWLVERLVSRATAEDVCARLEYHKNGKVWTRRASGFLPSR
jgi:transcriptional regulator GlxA family with amidase domain